MQHFQHEGLWWDPADPNDRWVGTLSFDRRDGIALSIVEPVSSPRFGGGVSPPLIFGVTTDGKAVSLLHCYETSVRMNFGSAGASRSVTIGANALIVGFHAGDTDPLLSSASVTLRHLSNWWGRTGLARDPTVERPNVVVRYTAGDPVLLRDDGAFRVSLRSALSGSVGKGKATLQESVTFEIEASNPTRLLEFHRRVRECADFLSIACLALCEIDELGLTPAGDDPRVHGTFHAVPIYRSRDERTSSIVHMLFRAEEVEHRLPALFSAWCSRADDLHDARALYFAGAYGGGFIEGKLLSLTQAVEAYHRRFRDGLYIDHGVFVKEVLEPLLAAIPAGISHSLQRSLADRLRYANEFSQRRRLRVLVREYAAALESLVANPIAYVDPIIDHRNEFTHFDPAARTSTTEVPPERVLLYNFMLRMLLEACFLESMGLEHDEITALLRRSETYKQLAVRFRSWGIVPPGPSPSGAAIG
ncbi:MAG: HEPN domain-containing protein [Vicinamibacterales bacterium]